MIPLRESKCSYHTSKNWRDTWFDRFWGRVPTPIFNLTMPYWNLRVRVGTWWCHRYHSHSEGWRKKNQWINSLQVGDYVCDCRYQHLRITSIDEPCEELPERDEVTLEDGSRCSLWHCCDPIDHTWSHDDDT